MGQAICWMRIMHVNRAHVEILPQPDSHRRQERISGLTVTQRSWESQRAIWSSLPISAKYVICSVKLGVLGFFLFLFK